MAFHHYATGDDDIHLRKRVPVPDLTISMCSAMYVKTTGHKTDSGWSFKYAYLDKGIRPARPPGRRGSGGAQGCTSLPERSLRLNSKPFAAKIFKTKKRDLSPFFYSLSDVWSNKYIHRLVEAPTSQYGKSKCGQTQHQYDHGPQV